MKLVWIAAAAGMAVAGAQPRSTETADLKVYVTGGSLVRPEVLKLAEGVASEIFGKIHIRLIWRIGPPAAAALLDQPVRVEFRTGHEGSEEAVARAKPCDFSIVVFYDRVRWAEQHGGLAERLLGHIFVHEITHSLQGITRHSATGMMKAAWSARDYEQMSLKPLRFEPLDIELIHEGFRTRAARCSEIGSKGASPASGHL